MTSRLHSSLRGKTLFIIMLAFAGLMSGLYPLTRMVILRGFYKVETDFALQNLEQTSSAISNELDILRHSADQYADWDSLLGRDENRRGGSASLPASFFEQLRVNFAVVVDGQGRKLLSQGFNLPAMQPAQAPADIDRHLQPGSPLLGANHDVSGILMLATGPVLVNSSPIAPGDLPNGSSGGTLIVGRQLDADEILRLGAITHVPVEMQPIGSDTAPSDFRQAARDITDREPILFRPYSTNSLAAYQELHDVYGKPAVLIRVLLPRTIYQQGQTSLLQFLLLLLAAGMLFGAATMFLLERFVISRAAALSDGIARIGMSGDLAARLPVFGNDEIARLGSVINSMLDDLERGQIERHEERARLAVMVEEMPALLWTTDTQLRFTSSTGAALEALGQHTNSIVGQTVAEYYRTDDPGYPAITAHRKALAGQSVTYEMEWEGRIFDCHARPLHDNQGAVVGVIGVALDVTERKQLTDQLRQSQKMQAVGELAGGIAHDFNNLLMVMKGHAQLLLEQLIGSPPMLHSVQQIDKAADRAAGLTRQLLAFSRKQVLQPRVLDMNDLVAGMIKMFSRVIGENIEMAFVPASNLGHVKADPGQIEQVLLNLVVNARDAMPNGGRLTIGTANTELDESYAAQHTSVVPGWYVMLTVTDTGHGMDSQTRSRIFEPFFTTKGPGKGTGLGLATVYGVVKQSGGFIWVYSEVGHGTTFKIYLPKVMAAVDAPVAEKQPAAALSGSETILFVEDEQNVRELVRDYLKHSGYNIIEASDGTEALEIAASYQGPIHLLITDVVMPRLSGREVATQMADQRPAMKVLYVSGYTDDTVFRHGVLEGGMEFLQKPFNMTSLAKKIREVLKSQPTSVA
jgi:PAS domain S-box-containing protein